MNNMFEFVVTPTPCDEDDPWDCDEVRFEKIAFFDDSGNRVRYTVEDDKHEVCWSDFCPWWEEEDICEYCATQFFGRKYKAELNSGWAVIKWGNHVELIRIEDDRAVWSSSVYNRDEIPNSLPHAVRREVEEMLSTE